ncbi:hypothetical protein DQZ30_18825 [Salmonella enterica subsp. diarizonae]|uniref:Uncharacterized protein n=1 Tax=Salmonella diarizonae TaxID=59204 RepID=A0A6C8XYY2_SALDZ|nr:hypothetical protein [Salmonella enterica]EBJ7482331.1 hypothetical protein [Salmonella enterica]ECI4530935.1 hypothetical protein [Salmonella enterica subsp. diarizonae]MIE70594.1 hypothetical protein [Salmonella enterica subsp. diarizonae]
MYSTNRYKLNSKLMTSNVSKLPNKRLEATHSDPMPLTEDINRLMVILVPVNDIYRLYLRLAHGSIWIHERPDKMAFERT